MLEADLKGEAEQTRSPHSRTKSARCCAGCCASAARASTTSWCRAPTSSPSRRATRLAELLRTFGEAGVSRIPLFSETLDDPRGMIHVKDLFRWLTQEAAADAVNTRISVAPPADTARRPRPPSPPSTQQLEFGHRRSFPSHRVGEDPPAGALRAAVDAGDQPAHPHAVDAHPHGAGRRRVRRHRRPRHHRGPRRADRRRYRGRARRGRGGPHLHRAQARSRRLRAHADQAARGAPRHQASEAGGGRGHRHAWAA